jgi:hypothetical protein
VTKSEKSLLQICFICAVKECELRAIHIDGSDNRLPDMLSRRSLSNNFPTRAYVKFVLCWWPSWLYNQYWI